MFHFNEKSTQVDEERNDTNSLIFQYVDENLWQ